VTDSAWWSLRLRAMGCDVDVRGYGSPSSAATVAPLLTRLERCWSRFDPNSDLSALNSTDTDEVQVPLLLAAAVRRAVIAWQETGGAFDPTVHDALVAAGYDCTFDEVSARAAPAAVPLGAPVPGCSAIAVQVDDDLERGHLLDERAPLVWVRRPAGVRLDLGGIGKGMAADLVADALHRDGCRSVVVSLGGDVAVRGDVPAGGFVVPVLDPWADAVLTSVVLARPGAVVTTSTRRRRWQVQGGGWAHHVIDPCSGRPAATDVAAVVAVASEAWWAESVAKAALVIGSDGATTLLADHGIDALVIGDDTEVRRVGTTVVPPGTDAQLCASTMSVASSARELMPSLA